MAQHFDAIVIGAGFLAHMIGDYGEEPYAIPTYQGDGVKISTFYG